MNLQQTIAELEQQAAKYTQAANTLRALLDTEQNEQPTEEPAPEETGPASATPTQNGTRRRGRTSNKGNKKSGLSAETRAKISEGMKLRHQQKKEQQVASAGAPE